MSKPYETVKWKGDKPERSVEEWVELSKLEAGFNLIDETLERARERVADFTREALTDIQTQERQKREEMVEAERERIVNILKQSYLMTNGYKDTDNVRTCMYIENEGFNIAINKRLDFFIEQITQPNNK